MAQDYSDWLRKKSDIGNSRLAFDVLTSPSANYEPGVFSSNNFRYSYLRYRAVTVSGCATGSPDIVTAYAGNPSIAILSNLRLFVS
jgi:hypothetical protein